MTKRLYVGNLPYTITEQSLTELFSAYNPSSVTLISDKFSGRSKGFGFVEIENDDSALQAIEALNGKEVESRALTVNEARPMESRGDRKGGFGGGRGRGGFGGGPGGGSRGRGGFGSGRDRGREGRRDRW